MTRARRIAAVPRRRIAIAAVLLTSCAVLVLGITHVHRKHQVIRLGYELATEARAIEQLEEDRRRLRLERSMLRNPDRIERLARELGMVRPDPTNIRVVGTRPTKVAGK